MNFKLNLRIKVFVTAVLIIVLAQVGFSIKNVQIFQKSHIATLKTKYEKLGRFLKSDVERILSIGIPLTKLVKMEKTLHRTLESGPELSFIEITDASGNVLYFADHDTMEQVEPGERKSLLKAPDTARSVDRAGLTREDTSIIIPVIDPRRETREGYINLHITPEKIVETSNQIFLDMITVILTSLLITFELLGFFVAYEISSPLTNISRAMDQAIKNDSPMPIQNFLFMDELCTVVDRFNRHMLKLNRCLTPVEAARKSIPKIRQTLEEKTDGQIKALNGALNNTRLMEKLSSSTAGRKDPNCLSDTCNLLYQLREALHGYSKRLHSFTIGAAGTDRKNFIKPRAIHYEFIRPLAFLFVMADGFSISFLPMYIDSLYQPIPGIPREVVLALPISLFMLTLAVGMPLTGTLTDRQGWYRPMLAGILLNAAGHFFTGIAATLLQLILFRCITAAGFAMVFMACQQFIVSNTTVKKRAMGMSSFLAAFFSGDICGTVIGGMLVERIGFSNIFFLSAGFSFITLLVSLLIFQQHREHRPQMQKETCHDVSFSLKKLFWIFRDKDVCTVLFFQAIPAKIALVGIIFYFVPLYLESIEVLQSNIGRIIICYGLSLVFLGPLFSRYLGKERLRKYNILAGGLITAAVLFAFRLNPGASTVVYMVLLIGVAHTFSMSSQAALISETSFVKQVGSGTGMGIFRFWERIGNISGPLLVGYLIAKQGYVISLTILGGVTLATSLVYLALINTQKRQ